ncbi:MAG: cobalt-precorrin-6A reductase [Alphaproteobacteria bacterium GM202ARS2]|nr:cobalt-precorrin-6A reductase [Alphaproteobacteria bacterium GM202ARS2]
MKAKVLVLGGSTQARDLCCALRQRGEEDVILSLAGATQEPETHGIAYRRGGFGGIEGLRAYLKKHTIAAVIDATHPYAQQMKRHAAEACASLNIARVACWRPAWTATPRDNWLRAKDSATAARHVAENTAQWHCVFLSIGRRDMAYFQGITCRWLIRVIDEPTVLPGPTCTLVRARGPFSYEDERALLQTHLVSAVVSRNSGGDMTRAKIDAARDLGLSVVMIDAPPKPQPPTVVSTAEAMAWLDSQGLGQRPNSGGGMKA